MIQDSIFYINRTLLSNKPEEKILQAYHDVTLDDEKVKIDHLYMKVTTHRIILEGTGEHTFLIDGDKINEVLISESGLLWGKEYYVKVRTQYGKVKFQLKNYKEAEVTINGMMKNRQWEKKPTTTNQPKLYSGLFNKLEKQKEKIDENAHKVGESFTSFQGLFGNLRQIKDVMKEMKGSTGQVDGDSTEVNQILKDIGFVSVLSKDDLGRDFLRHLSQDLYSICTNTLFKKYGGMVSLLDLFYFYNMKRQMELVSPEEIQKACLLFQKLGLNAKLVSYPNNIKMIQSTSFDQSKDFQEHFNQYFTSYERGYTAEQLSRKKGLPLAIIQIKLQKATKKGWLAIDSRIQGIKYYKNLILTIK